MGMEKETLYLINTLHRASRSTRNPSFSLLADLVRLGKKDEVGKMAETMNWRINADTLDAYTRIRKYLEK